MNELAISGSNFTIRETGIEFHDDLTKEQWFDLGQQLARVGKCIGFVIGDWINYGEKRWGEIYSEIIAKTGFDYQTVRNYAWVAGRVQLSLRKDNLDFSHHLVVAKLKTPEDQKHWLEAAEKHNLSVRRLRMSMNAGRIVSIDEMNGDSLDRGTPTYMTWLNKLLHWWTKRTKDDPIECWDDQDRERLKRDLEPWVRIYQQL